MGPPPFRVIVPSVNAANRLAAIASHVLPCFTPLRAGAPLAAASVFTDSQLSPLSRTICPKPSRQLCASRKLSAQRRQPSGSPSSDDKSCRRSLGESSPSTRRSNMESSIENLSCILVKLLSRSRSRQTRVDRRQCLSHFLPRPVKSSFDGAGA